MKIIITGASGSLGAFLTKHYAEKGHEIYASGRDQKPHDNLLKYATYLKADITQEFELPKADLCINTAALSDDKGAWKNFYNANVVGTENILKAAKHCKQFIHISSSSVYLPNEKLIPESLAGKQNNKLLSFYGASKLASEELIQQKAAFEQCFILRPRALYGVGDKKILPRMLHLEKKEKLYTPGKMNITVSMTHYKNLAHAIDCCVNSSLKGINTYNVADENPYILMDVLRSITQSIYGKKLTEKPIPIGLLKLMSKVNLGGITPLLVRSLTKDMALDISKIKKELHYQPSENIARSLPELKDWVENIGGIEVVKKAERKIAWEI